MPQSIHHLCSRLPLDSHQRAHITLVPGSPELDIALHTCTHHGWEEGKDHLPQPAGYSPPNTVRPRVPNISKDGDSPTPPGNLFHCLTTPMLKKVFRVSTQNYLCSNVKVSRLGNIFMLKTENTFKTGSHLCIANIAPIFMAPDISSMFLKKKKK